MLLSLLCFTSCIYPISFWGRNNPKNPRNIPNRPRIYNPFKKDILHAPQREDYVRGKIKIKGCVFCNKIQGRYDRRNRVVKRLAHHLIILNDFPYSKGHILVTPKRHVKDINSLTRKEKRELIMILSKAPKILMDSLKADGVNIGVNIEEAAGASIPDHLHVHIVPRYHKGNPNRSGHGFLEAALGGKLISWRLSRLRSFLKKKFGRLKPEKAGTLSRLSNFFKRKFGSSPDEKK